MNAVLSRRFEELLIQAKAVEATKITEADPLNGRPVTRLEMEEFLGWNLRAKNLLERACGPDSLHMKAFQDNEHNSFLTTADIFPRLKAIFLAAKEDFEGGYRRPQI